MREIQRRNRGFFCLILALIISHAVPLYAAPEGWPESLRLGVIPGADREMTMKVFKPLAESLEKYLGIKVLLTTSDTYEDIIRGLGYGNLDMAKLGPKSYVETVRRGTKVDPLVMQKNKFGDPGYYAVIISKKGSGISKMEQIRGRSFTFTDPNSTSGYLVPRVLLSREFAINPKKDFKSVSFSGSHSKSIHGVKDGIYEIAATNTNSMYREVKNTSISMDDFNIIWRSDLIPGDVFCIRSGMPQKLKSSVKTAMLKLNNEKEMLDIIQLGGFQETDDKTYDIIRELQREKAKNK